MGQLRLTHHKPIAFADELLPHICGVGYPECEDFPVLPPHLDQQYITCGYFSSVWAIPGNPFRVLKVSHRESDACRHYLRWAYDQPTRFAPKIHSIDYYHNLMLIEMDRYYQPKDFDEWGYDRDKVPGSKILRQRADPDLDDPYEAFCFRLTQVFHGYKFDLHRDNLMVDREGNYIITDPVSFINTDEWEAGL